MNTDRIEKQILLRAPRQRVWRALSDSNEFGTWFGLRFENGPFEPGKHMRGVLTPTKVNPEVGRMQKSHEGLLFEITVERMEAQQLFSFRWHPFAIDLSVDYSKEPTTLIEFTLHDAPEGILLNVSESGFDQIPLERRLKAFAANEQGWTLMVQVIGEYVAGKS